MNKNTKKLLKIFGVFVFLSLILIYAFFRSRDLIFGVKIKNVSLTDGTTYHQSIVHVSGNAKNATTLTLNGREISIDQQGNWNETIALLLGYNAISIEARDKFGHMDEKNYKLIYIQ